MLKSCAKITGESGHGAREFQMNYFNPVETWKRDQLQTLQLERLQKTVKRLYENVPFYKAKLDEAGFKPGDVKSLEDLKTLPFTNKDDLRDNYPFGLFAVPMRDIVRIHASSGTTGKATVVGYTAEDIEVWADLVARTIVAAGGSPDDIVHVSYGYGLFTGGLGLHYGVEKLGATALPMSGGNTKRQVRMMVDFGSTILCCTPSYALNIAEVMREMGVGRDEIRLKSGVLGAEPWSNEMRDQIERELEISAHDIYGLSEVVGPGVSIECSEKKGLHVFEDSFIPEIINPETGEVLPPGQRGELVFTNINKEGLALLRYRTRDISMLIDEECPCGRTHLRMERITGRTDDMLIIRGVNVFPSQVEMVLMQIPGLAPHYQLVVDRVDNLDILEVQVEVSPETFSDEIKQLEGLERKIRDEVQSYLGVSVKVRLMEPRSIGRSEGKAVRVVDKRKI
jgi:phenylacetate-CoA ligase